MKPTPNYDFPVSVWREGADYPSSPAEAFLGIYSVTLNHAISIAFIPAVDRRSPWPPVVPPEADHLATSDDARRMTLGLSPLVVTPDDARARTVETFLAGCDAVMQSSTCAAMNSIPPIAMSPLLTTANALVPVIVTFSEVRL